MNLDLLKKLVRLANNNPNENEANLAARKACKLLEEADFSTAPPVTPQRPASTYGQSSPTGRDPFKDIFDEMFRNATTGWKPSEAQERFWRGGSAGGGKSNRNPSEDDIRRENERIRREEQRFREQRNKENYYYKGPWMDEPREYKHAQERELSCSKCTLKIWTKFVGDEKTYVCNVCQWNKFNEERETGKWK